MYSVRPSENLDSSVSTVVQNHTVHTFWDREKPDQDKGIPVGPTNIVVNVTNGKVERIKLILSTCDGYRGLVASHDNRNIHATMRPMVF